MARIARVIEIDLKGFSMKYIITCIHYGLEHAEYVPVTVEAETLSKAKYKAFKAWKEAYRPNFNNQFKYFLKYVIDRTEKVTEN